MKKNQEAKMSYQEFFTKAILALRGEYKGVHPVYSGLNQAFRLYYPGEDPVEASKDLEKKGVLAIIPHKGKKGVMLYLAQDVTTNDGSAVLAKILG